MSYQRGVQNIMSACLYCECEVSAQLITLKRVNDRGELRYFLHAIYFKLHYQMYSYFLRRCIHRQTAILCDVPNREKKKTVIDGPPPLCIQMCSSSLKSIQIPAMLHHGGNLRLWRDIGHFLVSWGYI